MLGSSFNSPAESNYAPIESECLSVVNALNKTRYYTQGCDKLIVGTDHKPLLVVLNERSLESIANPRLEMLKEKTLGWRFELIHIPGKKLGGPDALSRVLPSRKDEMAYINMLDMKYMSGPAGEGERDMTTKEAQEGVLVAIRTVMSADHTMPDPELDVSGCLLASMELGIKSVS